MKILGVVLISMFLFASSLDAKLVSLGDVITTGSNFSISNPVPVAWEGNTINTFNKKVDLKKDRHPVTNPVPEPITLILLGSGLTVIGLMNRKGRITD